MRTTLVRFFFAVLLWLVSVPSGVAEAPSDYWYRGQAEISSYTLEQARYGEVHPGHAVLVFVTEDFSRSKQVKLDAPGAAGSDRVPVLKLNATRSFTTGIYPYSMMSSTFVPTSGDRRMLKSTTSSQEWCGHTFTQFNRVDEGYRVRQLSYFEGEGDLDTTLRGARLEDELWSWMRLAPESLPTGSLELVPGTVYLRLSHAAIRAYPAEATLGQADGNGLRTYTVRYPSLGRTLTVQFRAEFPHEIEGWSESYRSGFGSAARTLTTTATREKRLVSPYWSKNGRMDEGLRRELGLPGLELVPAGSR